MTDRGVAFAPRRVAVLLTDMEGSTRLWQEHAAVMPVVLMAHHRAVADVVAGHGGRLPPDQGEGDARLAVFTGDGAETVAVSAALALQAAFADLVLPHEIRVRVRMAVDVGEVVEFEGNVFGTVVNRCARLRGLGHGGQVLVSADVALACGGVTEVSLADLGEHSLRDVVEPLRVFQADPVGTHASFPALVGVLAAPVVLPEADSPMVGREDELSSLTSLVRERRLVTLTGTGGSGKTTLATEAARQLVPDFPGGVYFVDLVPVADVADVGRVIATVMGVVEKDDDPWAAITGAFSARKPLVILDNCEDLPDLGEVLALDAGSALRHVHVLATSRQPLGVEHEVVVPVPPLATPESETFTREELEASPAGMLLLTRALEARPGLVVDHEAAGHLGALARRLDGIPLALELAAARLKMQPVASLRSSLEESLVGLDDLTRRHPQRHRTLVDVLAWSVDHLDRESRDLLTVLATFVASPDLAAIAGVAGLTEADVLAPLSRLLDTSLARAVELDDAIPRFTLLVPVREHVRAVTPDEVAGDLADRHARYFLAWARDGSRTRYNTDRDHEWITEARVVRGDALAALDHLVVTHPAAAIELAVHLAVVWFDLGETQRGIATLTSLVQATGAEADPYRTLARLYLWLVAPTSPEIEAIYVRALELDEPGLAAFAAARWAIYEASQGAHAETARLATLAQDLAGEALEREATGRLPLDGLTRPRQTLDGLEAMETLKLTWRDPARALELAERAFAGVTGPHDPNIRAHGVLLVELAAESGRTDLAEEVLGTLALTIESSHVSSYYGRGLTAVRQGRYDDALALLEESLGHAASSSAQSRALAADILLTQKRPGDAAEMLRPYQPGHRSVFDLAVVTRQARACVALGEAQEAARLLDSQAEYALDHDASPGTLTYLVTRAMLTNGDTRRAWLQEYDDRVAATGVLPWPRDAADRAALADDT